MFDKRMEEAMQHFQINRVENWQQISPIEIESLPNFGPQFINYLRLHLANRGLTLKDDETPLYWQENLSIKRGVVQVDPKANGVMTRFTVLIDTGEQQPYTFTGLSDDKGNPLVVKTKRVPLGVSHGDYSLKGFEDRIHLERKSVEDCKSTVLGFGQHQDNFIKTLKLLAGLESSAVMVEGSRDEVLASCVARGKMTQNQMQRTLNRQIMAWEDDYRVPWIFSKNRRTSEIRTLWFLRRFWRNKMRAMKKANKR